MQADGSEAVSVHWVQAPSVAVGFCIDVLARDGLCVEPFHEHECRLGPLQQIGLDSHTWARWLRAVTDRTWSCDLLADGDHFELPAATVFQGHPLRDALTAKWLQYVPNARAIKLRIIDELGRANNSSARKQFVDEVRYLGGSPTIRFFVVNYVPHTRPLLLRPSAAVISADFDEFDSTRYFAHLLTAAKALAAAWTATPAG